VRQPPDSEVLLSSKALHHQPEDQWPCLLRPFPSLKHDLVGLEPRTTQHPDPDTCRRASNRSYRRSSPGKKPAAPGHSPKPPLLPKQPRRPRGSQAPSTPHRSWTPGSTAKVKGRAPHDAPGRHPTEAGSPRPLSAAPLLSCPSLQTQGQAQVLAADSRVLKNQRSGSTSDQLL
jgi:hypothetical protein